MLNLSGAVMHVRVVESFLLNSVKDNLDEQKLQDCSSWSEKKFGWSSIEQTILETIK